jgi:hypothetical protein
VSGESVARHIQMLLGSATPTFILFHSGTSKAKVIPGLFEHLIDFSLPNDAIVENILGTLKPLLGSQWERVFIPPKQTLDEAIARKMSPAVQSEPLPEPNSAHTLKEKTITPATKDSATVVDAPTGKKVLKSKDIVPTPAPAPPAEAFRISRRHSSPVNEPVPEDLLFAFEENYRSRSLRGKRSYVIALVCAVCVAGGWYLLTQKSLFFDSLTQKPVPASAPKEGPLNQAAVIPAPKPDTPPVPPVPPVPPPVATPPLPSFIPQGGLDRTFALKNPGWNRYVGEKYDFRVFSAPRRIEAIQVLSLSDAIPESLITSVLQEFTGKAKYQILSRTTKDGVRVESGKVQDKGEIILYKKNGAVEAFVVSVN